MSTNNRRVDVKHANRLIENLLAAGNRIMAVHYTSTDLNGTNTPRVTAIAVHNLQTGDTESFTIKKSAEESGVLTALTDLQKDTFEVKMIQSFKSFVRRKSNHLWVHWSMRGPRFGFEVIERRLSLLTGKPRKEIIADTIKYDLNSIINLLHTRSHGISGPRGKLLALAEMNNIPTADGVSGPEEVLMFNRGEYQRLEQSLSTKVNAIAEILKLVRAHSLVVNGGSPASTRFRWSLAGILLGIPAALWALIKFVLWQWTEAYVQQLLPVKFIGHILDGIISFFT